MNPNFPQQVQVQAQIWKFKKKLILIKEKLYFLIFFSVYTFMFESQLALANAVPSGDT